MARLFGFRSVVPSHRKGPARDEDHPLEGSRPLGGDRTELGMRTIPSKGPAPSAVTGPNSSTGKRPLNRMKMTNSERHPTLIAMARFISVTRSPRRRPSRHIASSPRPIRVESRLIRWTILGPLREPIQFFPLVKHVWTLRDFHWTGILGYSIEPTWAAGSGSVRRRGRPIRTFSCQGCFRSGKKPED